MVINSEVLFKIRIAMMGKQMSLIRISELNERFLKRKSSGKSKHAIQGELGRFLEVFSDSDRNRIDIQSFLHWVKPAILHDQYTLLKLNGNVDFSGYVMWAWVDVDTLEKYLNEDRFVIHPMNWNEGYNLIVVDFFVKDKSCKQAMMRSMYRQARNLAGLSHKDINICIRDDFGKIVKVKGARYEDA